MAQIDSNQLMQQALKMQEQMLQVQEQASKQETSSSAGGGMVKVTVTGDMRVKSIAIDPEALNPDDAELVQDMVIAAVNDALSQAEASASQQMSGLASGLGMPGLF